jgi:branched-chain amino acid transport system permease protein
VNVRRIGALIGARWWSLLGRSGLDRARWRGLPGWQRRAALMVFCGVLAFVVVVLVGVLQRARGSGGSVLTFDWVAYATFGILFVLLVPSWASWRRLPFRIPNPVRGGTITPPAPGKLFVPLAVLGLAVAYPYYADPPSKLFTIPVLGTFPQMSTMVHISVFAMMAVGLNIVVGYAGLLDLGYVAFFGIGAYAAAWFASPQFSQTTANGTVKPPTTFGAIDLPQGLGGIHINVWLVLVIAGCLTALAGMIIGLPTLRLRGDYLAIVTLGFGEILPQVARNGDHLFGFNLTNGPQGITPVDQPGFGHTLSSATGGFLPADYTVAGNRLYLFWWTGIGLVLLTIFASVRLRDSRLGRAWIAIREDEVAAAAMGVPLMRTKTWSYASGAFLGGVAGCFYASFNTGVFPDNFFFNISVFILCMVILSGMGNIWGVLLGAAFLDYLDREGLANIGGWADKNLGILGNLPLYSFGIYGAIILIVMLLRPQGLLPEARRKLEFETGVHDEPLADITRGESHAPGTEGEAFV